MPGIEMLNIVFIVKNDRSSKLLQINWNTKALLSWNNHQTILHKEVDSCWVIELEPALFQHIRNWFLEI